MYCLLCRVDFAGAEGKYDLHIQRAELERDNGRFECRLKEDGTGVELYTKAGSPTFHRERKAITLVSRDHLLVSGLPDLP
jgi:hypothetical protein